MSDRIRIGGKLYGVDKDGAVTQNVMQLIPAEALPDRVFIADRNKEAGQWFDIFDEFNLLCDMEGIQFAEVTFSGLYNDPWEAQVRGKELLNHRELISGYATKFRLEVRDSRLFIVRR